MKKVFILATLCFSVFSQAFAQAKTEKTPERGKFAAELGFTPFAAGGDAFKLNEGMLKARIFLSSKDALRVKLGFGLDNTSTVGNYTDENEDYNLKENAKLSATCTDFSFMVGYERHIFTKGRFDVYTGIELGYGMTNVSTTLSGDITNKEYDDDKFDGEELGNITYTFHHYVPSSSQVNQKVGRVTGNRFQRFSGDFPDLDNKSSLRYFTGNLFIGVDCYVWKNLYLGAECGLNFRTGSSPNLYDSYNMETSTYDAQGKLNYSYTEKFDGATNTMETITINGKDTKTEKETGAIKEVSTSTTKLGFYVEPAIRIGWRF